MSPASYAIVEQWTENVPSIGYGKRQASGSGKAPTQDELIKLLVQLNAADLLQTEATRIRPVLLHAPQRRNDPGG
jgi:hypothetical protein